MMREQILTFLERNSRIDLKELAIMLGSSEAVIANEVQQMEKEQLHRSVTDVDEIRSKFANLRTEYLENEENWAFPVNGQNRLLAVIMIDRKVSEEELSPNKKLIHSMIENISLALERIEITIERVRDRQRMERGIYT